MDKQKTCCFTGHRQIAAKDYDRLYGEVKKLIEKLNSENDVTVFIAGGALGFDTLAAKAVLELKDVLDISLILYLPCESQTHNWTKSAKEEYSDILRRCDGFRYISLGYTSGCMLKRNRAMVDSSAFCIAYKKRNYGGTAFTVNYACSAGLTVINLK